MNKNQISNNLMQMMSVGVAAYHNQVKANDKRQYAMSLVNLGQLCVTFIDDLRNQTTSTDKNIIKITNQQVKKIQKQRK